MIMPDVAMCQDVNCESRYTCYRYRAIPSQEQSYTEPRKENGVCKVYWHIELWRGLRSVGIVDDEIREGMKCRSVLHNIQQDV